jgi:hypothetical protein
MSFKLSSDKREKPKNSTNGLSAFIDFVSIAARDVMILRNMKDEAINIQIGAFQHYPSGHLEEPGQSRPFSDRISQVLQSVSRELDSPTFSLGGLKFDSSWPLPIEN